MPKSKLKAGVIPYYYEPDGTLRMLFQVSSNPRFGGPDPMISKGDVEKDEDIMKAAIREGHEELGLNEFNIKGISRLWESKMYGYQLIIYAAKIEDPEDFCEPHWETARTEWMTIEEFEERGRKDHRFIVEYFNKKLTKNS